MRNALRFLVLVALISVGSTASLRAQTTSSSSGTVAFRVSAVVHSFVRVETTSRPGLPPTTRVLTNDPALRAMMASEAEPEVIAPEAITTLTGRHQGGGAESRGGAELAGPVVIRYTLTTP